MITKITIPSRDPRLKRHINHDSRSWNFRYDTRFKTIHSSKHIRHIQILDQGNVGSCTGNAGIGNLGTDPFFGTVPGNPKYHLNEAGALKLYSDAEIIDGTGPYPPNDEGSSGLSIAKALVNANMVNSQYQHTFTLNDTLIALSSTPILLGIPWYDDMFNPAGDGKLSITGDLAGGHEIVCREIDAQRQIVWIDNSWGNSWGVSGRAYLSWHDLGVLLSQQGDVVVLFPISVTPPAPQPTPTHDQSDVVLNNAIKVWQKSKGL